MRLFHIPIAIALLPWLFLAAGCSERSEAAPGESHRVETPRYEVPIKVPPVEPRIASLWLAAQTSVELEVPICHLVPDYSFAIKTHFRSLQVDDGAPIDVNACVLQTFGCQRDRAHFVLIDQRVGAC